MSERSLFQPALPMRGVTRWKYNLKWYWSYFNPHSPCGE